MFPFFLWIWLPLIFLKMNNTLLSSPFLYSTLGRKRWLKDQDGRTPAKCTFLPFSHSIEQLWRGSLTWITVVGLRHISISFLHFKHEILSRRSSQSEMWGAGILCQCHWSVLNRPLTLFVDSAFYSCRTIGKEGWFSVLCVYLKMDILKKIGFEQLQY